MPAERSPRRGGGGDDGGGPGRGSSAARIGLGLALAAVLVVAVLVGIGGTAGAPTLADAVPYDGRSPVEPSGEGTRVLVGLARPALARTGIEEPERQRGYVRSLARESAALRSALGARGVRLSDVVTFERTWNGFAATVRTRDLAAIDSLGVRARPVRRFYPASSEPARVPGTRAPRLAAALGGAPVAVLDSGVERGHPLLARRLERGYDAVDGDDEPEPAADPRGGRRESGGTALAGIVAAAGERVLPIRVAGLQPSARGGSFEEVAISDQLLAGLERAVDPDGDGATDDRVAVALVGVNAPYAGFTASAEAQAIRGADALGTLVVAPAGNEGSAASPAGTVGSPGAARAALTVAALAAPRAVARIEVGIGDADVADAALLAGAPPRSGLRSAGPVDGADTAELRRASLRGRVAIVRAGDHPGARVAAAAAAGARAVLVAEPRRSRPLPALAAGRVSVPVVGVTGTAAERVLGVDPGSRVSFGAARSGVAVQERRPSVLSPFSSRGPAAGGSLKPDLAAPGAALTAVPGGAAIVGGSAVAAAHAAVEAARLARARPDARPSDLRAALIAAAAPERSLPVRGAGAGALRRPARDAYLTAGTRPAGRGDPCPDRGRCARIVLANRSASETPVRLELAPDRGTVAALAPTRLTIPAGAEREIEINVGATNRLASGRLLARAAGVEGALVASHPFAIAAAPAPPIPVGRLRLRKARGRVTGARFMLGAFERGDPLGRGTTVAPVERLDLTLVTAAADRLVRRLTPTGGARELLPAEYGYTLPATTLRELTPGRRYAFRAVARGPAGGRATVVHSESFAR